MHTHNLFFYLLLRTKLLVVCLTASILPLVSCMNTIEIHSIGRRATLQLNLNLPPILTEKLQSLLSLSRTQSIFNTQAIIDRLRTRQGITVNYVKTSNINTLQLSLTITDLPKMLTPAISLATDNTPPYFQYSESKGMNEISFALSKDTVQPLFNIVSDIEPLLLDVLSPPALDTDPLSRKEYKELLLTLFGSEVIDNLEASTIIVTFALPSKPFTYSGLSLLGKNLTKKIKIMDLLVLDTPIQFAFSWAGTK